MKISNNMPIRLIIYLYSWNAKQLYNFVSFIDFCKMETATNPKNKRNKPHKFIDIFDCFLFSALFFI